MNPLLDGDFEGDDVGRGEHSCHAGCACQRTDATPELPDEVIEQAARAMDKANRSTDPADDWYILLALATAPALIAHGREQEKARIRAELEGLPRWRYTYPGFSIDAAPLKRTKGAYWRVAHVVAALGEKEEGR